MTEDRRPLAVEMSQIVKRFPGVLANDRVDFSVAQGEIHGLLGENGSGKTVLMSILYGLYRPDNGQILLHSAPVQIKNPAAAIALKIGMVHQHFMLIPNMTVAENVVLGFEPPGLILRSHDIAARVTQFAAAAKIKIDPNAMIEELPLGIRQRVEILKILYRKAEVLILDEPTAVLTPQGIDDLFASLRTLRDQGKTIIFIAHKLKEILSICDRATVLRRGKTVGTVEISRTNENELTEMMIGSKIVPTRRTKQVSNGKLILQVEEIITTTEHGAAALRGATFKLHAGEILGIAGIEGNGQTELVEVITGLRRPTGGKMLLNGVDLTGMSPKTMLDHGLRHIPEDRHRQGIILDFSVMENLILGDHQQPIFKGFLSQLKHRFIRQFTDRRIEEFQIQTPSRETMMRSLSGGNQQRTVVARIFNREPTVVIASQPTRGLDVKAAEYVHRKLIELSDQGTAVLLVSADLDEVMALSDRIVVMLNGKLTGASDRPTRRELGLLMLGENEAGA
jgi:simple sugar transport system ATP-binding protein